MTETTEDYTNDGRIVLAEDAPTVDLNIFVVENKGLEIAQHKEMGRIMLASKDFNDDSLYASLLCEYPALICQSADYLSFMETFLEASIEIQVGILDMFYQPLDSPIGKSLVEPAKMLFLLGVLEDFLVIHQLLAIYVTNGIHYADEKTALPLFATKFSHSCNPNVGYSSMGSNGCIEFKLLQPIRKGEQACFSYLTDLFETPTPERRQLLLSTKSFFCQCDRCKGPDFCRCLSCAGCSKLIPCTYSNDTQNPSWKCHDCGISESMNLLQKEKKFEKVLNMLETTTETDLDFDTRVEYSPDAICKEVEACGENLSPTHYLTVKALRLLVNVSTSHAFFHIKNAITRGLSKNTPKIFSLLRTSVEAGIRLVLACECVASNCTGCYWKDNEDSLSPYKCNQYDIRHLPNYDRATPMRHIMDALDQLPLHWWPPMAMPMGLRYIPILRAKFSSVADELEQKVIRKWVDVTCLDCGTHWNPYPIEI